MLANAVVYIAGFRGAPVEAPRVQVPRQMLHISLAMLDKHPDARAQILARDGSLNRQELRARIFADPAQREWLEMLTHPAIRELTDQRSLAATGPYVIVAIPLLVETGGANRFDHVLVVDCDPELQIARLAARDGNSRQQAERILAAQASRAERLAVADDVINNDGDIASLRDQVGELHRQFVRASILKSEWAQSDKDAS
jgi:dephospho-CoA kinase